MTPRPTNPIRFAIAEGYLRGSILKKRLEFQRGELIRNHWQLAGKVDNGERMPLDKARVRVVQREMLFQKIHLLDEMLSDHALLSVEFDQSGDLIAATALPA